MVAMAAAGAEKNEPHPLRPTPPRSKRNSREDATAFAKARARAAQRRLMRDRGELPA